MVGDHCYVIAVKPESDAAVKGLRLGDEVLSIDGQKPSRGQIWVLKYLYYTLRPQPGMIVKVKRPDGTHETLTILAKVREGKRIVDLTGEDLWAEIREGESEARLHRHRYQEDLAGVFVWKMPQFDLDDREVDRVMARIGDRHSLILDLRGNGGGFEAALLRMIGNLFDRDVTIGNIHRRKETKPLVSKTRGAKAYKGRIIVLIDQGSGSAAEILARAMQLEKRGTVIGDRSAGAVMRSKFHVYQGGAGRVVFYGASITDADVIMSDGKSLEKAGVTPDEFILPSASDLAAQRDPALSRAAALAGVQLDPVRAGTFFPIEWRN
jgi:C-terminal processing protease CtpA/Prc